MQDKSINGALLALRKQIIRGKLDGLGHVEALLGMRGVDMPAVLPAKRATSLKKGHARAAVLEALRGGPKRRPEIVAHFARKWPDQPHAVNYKRVDHALDKMRIAGLVVREGRVWRLAQ